MSLGSTTLRSSDRGRLAVNMNRRATTILNYSLSKIYTVPRLGPVLDGKISISSLILICKYQELYKINKIWG